MPRLPTVSLPSVALRLQAQGPQTATELARAFDVDRSQISRVVNAGRRNIVQIGAARRARYALRRPIRNVGDVWPVSLIDEHGRASEFGHVESYYGGWRMHWSQPAPAWSRIVADPDGWTDGFPFFIGDLRPQGFVGRAIARRVSLALGVPDNPTTWSDDDVLIYLQSQADDLPGNFVIGDEPTRRALASPTVAVAATPRSDYPRLATEALAGGIPGSSAGGEQPKFAIRIQDGGTTRAVLVKFSTSMRTAIGRRWADLLLAEAIASDILAEHREGMPGVTVHDIEDRRFLEVPRFDRVGTRGRRGAISLAALQGTEGAIDTTDWVIATEHFASEGIVSSEAAAAVRRRRAFGELIGNSDMHPGNLSFYLGSTVPLHLAPSYDMLPMLWAPLAGGEIVERTLTPLPPVPRQTADWLIAAPWALTFWRRLAADSRLSPDFLPIAERSAETVERLHREVST